MEKSSVPVSHWVVLSSKLPGSGVPGAATCHSLCLIRRLPDSAHARAAWCQVMQAVGTTPGIDAAYTPGDGGFEPGAGVRCPSLATLCGKSL